MSEKTIAELRAELAAREAAETKTQLERQLAAIEADFKDQCRCETAIQRSWVSWTAARYTQFKIEGGVIRYRCDRINCHWSNKPKSEASVYRSSSGYWEEWEFPRLYQQLDPAKFAVMWEAVNRGAHVFMDTYVKGLESTVLPLEPVGEDEDKPVEEVPDVPFIQLESHEATMLPRAFMLHGHRYLLTPNSRRCGLHQLTKEYEDLYRGSHLFEACDMGYVNNKRDQIARLRLRLLTA